MPRETLRANWIIKREIRTTTSPATNLAEKASFFLPSSLSPNVSVVNGRAKIGEGERQTFIALRGKMSVRREDTDACRRWTNIKNDTDELSDNSFEITIRDGTAETAEVQTLNAIIDR